MNRPSRRTPAGAYLRISRGPRWTTVEVDRISITDATEAQAATADRLSRSAAHYVAAHGKRGGVGFGGGRVIWSATVPTSDAEVALEALLALEAGDPAPAEALAARYTATAVP